MAASRGTAYGPPPVDDAPGASPESAIPVRILTSAARDVVEGAFPPVWVRGEVSDFKAHRNGHWYFALRDHEAQVTCVVWATNTRRIPAPPDDGMQVIALGQMTVFRVRGTLQFIVRQLAAEGDGLWRKALEQARKRLEADGLLDPARKRRLPAFPRRIAVITSPDGAALHDIVRVAQSRSPDVEIVLVPARVQGDGAPESLCRAIAQLCRWGEADVVIIGRGGGAREDLWAFNDERVARAVANCPTPTVSAVGHEIDTTLCDLVADVRAATPSAAAEIVVPSRREMVDRIHTLGKRLSNAALRRRERAITATSQVRARLVNSASRVVERRHARVQLLGGQMHALSPLATLGRGFAVARGTDGATLSNVSQFSAGQPFDLWLRDGIVAAKVSDTRIIPPEFRTEGQDSDEI